MTGSIIRHALIAAAACSFVVHTASPALAQATAVDYERDVRPILANRCFGCHGPRQQQSGLRLDLRQNALRGGDYGVVIVPGKASESKLIQRVTGDSAGLQMPPTGELPPNEIDVLKSWINSGAEMPGRAAEAVPVDVQTEPRVQMLFDRIAAHDLQAVRSALASDKSLAQSADGFGTTALMQSAYAGTVDIMQALIDGGANVNAKNRRSATALHWAAADPAKVKLLLFHGANVNAKSVDGRTALHVASGLPAGASVVKLLLEVGAEVDARSLVGQTPLFSAVTVNAESTRLLLDKGANVNATAQTGTTPLMSVRGADIDQLLVEHGADVKARSKRGETALADAASRGDLAACRMLLDKGADVNAVDYRGYTPLLQAVQYDRDAVDLVKLLLSRGANVSAVAEGNSATSIAARRGDTELTRLLREAATRTGTSRQH